MWRQGPNALPIGVRSAGRPYAPQYHRSRCGYHRRAVRSNASMPPQSQPVFLRRSLAVIKRPVRLWRRSTDSRLRCVLPRSGRWQVCIVEYVALAVLRLCDRDVPARKALVERSDLLVEEKTLAERSVAARATLLQQTKTRARPLFRCVTLSASLSRQSSGMA
jgi:hypothetical protein